MNDSATAPSFIIPTRFEGATLSTLAESIAAGCPGGLSSKLVLDFQKLSFIEPAGVVFLSNLIWWLHQNGTVVNLTSIDKDVEALRYLDDSRFFEQHCGAKVRENSSPRGTTIPLQPKAPNQSPTGWSIRSCRGCRVGWERHKPRSVTSKLVYPSCSTTFGNIPGWRSAASSCSTIPNETGSPFRWRIWAGHTCEGPGGAARAC